MIHIKEGADISDLEKVCLKAIYKIHWLYKKLGYDLWVTSGVDGKHSKSSFHYLGLAFDIRIREFKDDVNIHDLVADIKVALGQQFDVILHNTHIHVEYDPRELMYKIANF